MGDNEGGAPLCQIVKGPLDLCLGDGVQGGGCLVQDQDGGIFQEDPGNGDALLLSAGEQGAPLSHIGPEALGHGKNILVDLRLFCRFNDLRLGSVGPPIADIFKDGVGKQEHLLLHDADAGVDALLGHVPDVLAVDADGPVRHIVEPGNQLAQGTLAAAGGTDNGYRLPGGNVQAHVVEHRQISVIGKGDVFHLDMALYILKILGILPVPHGRLGAHDLHEPVETGEAVGKQLGEAGKLAHGVYKGGNVQAEGHKVPVVHFATHNEPAAQGDDHHVQAGEEELHGGIEQAHGLVEAGFGIFELLVGGGEPVGLHFLVAEGLGGADAGKAGFDLGIDVPGLLLHGGGGPAHVIAHGHNHRDEHRDHDAHHQGQLPADSRHDNEGADDGEGGGDNILRAVVGQLRQLKQVGGEAAHELAGAVAVIEVKAHFLHVGEQVPADVRLHPDAENVAEKADSVVKKRPDHIEENHRGHQREEGPVLPLRKQIVQRLPGDQRESQVNEGNADGTAHIYGE